MAPFQFLKRRLSRRFRSAGSRLPAQALVRRVFTPEELAEPLRALAAWLYGDAPPDVPPDSEARIRALEARYDINIPEDFRRYLSELAPGEDRHDDEGTTWWSLGRVRSIPDEYGTDLSDPAIAGEAGVYLFFADYLIWCWAWAVCCSDGPNRGRVAFIGGPDGFVADSFFEFVERYLADPDVMANSFPSR